MYVFKLVNSEGHLGRSSTPKTYSKAVDTRRRIDVKTFKRRRVSTGNFVNRLEGEKISFQDETEETFLMTMIHVVKMKHGNVPISVFLLLKQFSYLSMHVSLTKSN